MAAEEETAYIDSTNPHLKLEMTDEEEQIGSFSTPEVEIKSELLEGRVSENTIGKVSPDPQVTGDSLMPHETVCKEKKKDTSKLHVTESLRSTCRPRSKDPRRCQKHFREMIGKHEIKKEELEKKEGDLRQRLEMLECSMPAVMVWNIWRMSQGAPVPSIRRVMEKQFQGFASGTLPYPSTPSQHYDCRVREVEAERKQAQRRADEARALWAEKEFALEEQKKKLEEARKTEALHKQRIEKLTVQVQELRKARDNEKAKNEGSSETGECGEIRSKQVWLGDAASTTSVKSTDLECLARLQELAEAELCMKRHITELEHREETYMRTLQQADELWSKMESDTASTVSGLQEQLDLKVSANQQLADKVCYLEDAIEKMNTKLANCRNELGKFVGIERVDAIIGNDDDHAQIADKDTLASVKMKDDDTMVEKVRMVDMETMNERKEVIDTETMTEEREMIDKDTITEDGVPCADDEICGELSDDSSSEGEPCGPNFSCNDIVFSLTDMEDTENRVLTRKLIQGEDDQIVMPRTELGSGLGILNDIQQTISVFSNCSSKKDNVEKLSKYVRSYLQEAEDITSQKNIISTHEIQEIEIEQEGEVKIKHETVSPTLKADAGQESDEEYIMAIENLSDDKIPSNETEESEKIQVLETGVPIVIGNLSSEKIVQDGKVAKGSDEGEIIEIDTATRDQVEHDQENLFHVLQQQDFSVKARKEEGVHEDIGEEIVAEEEKMKDEENLSQNLHLQKLSGKVEKHNAHEDLGKENVLEVKKSETIVKGDDEKKVNDDVQKKILSKSKQMRALMEEEKKKEIRDKSVPKAEGKGEIIDVIPKEKDEGKWYVISKEDKLFDKVRIPAEERQAEENEEKGITGENLGLQAEPVLFISGEDDEEMLSSMRTKTTQGVGMLSTEKLKEEVSIAEEYASVLPIDKVEEGRAIMEGTGMLPTNELKEEAAVLKDVQFSPIEEIDEDIGEKELGTGSAQLAIGIIPSILQNEKIGEPTPEDLPSVLSGKEIPHIPAEGRKSYDTGSSTCSCLPTMVPREEAKVEKDQSNCVSKEEVEIYNKSICSCKDKDASREETRSRPKLIIIRKTVCRHPDEIKLHLQNDETASKIKKPKLSYIKVKDESIGTVVSVRLQTQKAVKKEQSLSKQKFVDNKVGKTKEIQTVGTGSTVIEKHKGPTDSESKCFMCKKELSSKNDVYKISDIQAAFWPKMSHPKSELSKICCICQQKQDSKSRIQSRDKFQAPEKPNKFPSPQEKRDQSCLAKMVRREVAYRERKQKSESESNVKNWKRSPGSILQTETSQSLTEPSSDCTCISEKTSSVNGKKSTNGEEQFKGDENRSCHCGDSD